MNSEGFTTYVVQKGDTIAAVTRKFGVGWSRLRNLNPHAVGCLESTGRWFLKEGAALKLSEGSNETISGEFRQTLENVESRKTHRVQPGDTLWGLSKRYGARVDAWVRINHLSDADRIQVGQELLIPEPVRQETVQNTARVASPGQAHHASSLVSEISGESVRDHEILCGLGPDLFPMPLYTGEIPYPEPEPEIFEPPSASTKPLPPAAAFEGGLKRMRNPLGSVVPDMESTETGSGGASGVIQWGPVSFSSTSSGKHHSNRLRIQYEADHRLQVFSDLDFHTGTQDPEEEEGRAPVPSFRIGVNIAF